MSKLTFVFLFVFTAARAQVLTEPDAAFRAAQELKKPVLLIFSGSDWCAPCIRFDHEILSDSSFLHYAGDHIVLLKADFPQRRKLAQPLRSAYEKLADRYNPEGAFPKLVVLDAEKKTVATLSFLNQTPAMFVRELQRILN